MPGKAEGRLGSTRFATGPACAGRVFKREESSKAMNHLIKYVAVVLLVTTPAMANAPTQPAFDFDYEGPCAEGTGAELGLGPRGASVGGSICISRNQPSCPYDFSGHLGMAYGECAPPTRNLCVKTCTFIELFGHKIQYCWDTCS